MSYTHETTHFGIPLPLGSDLTTPMDYNAAAEAVDEALFEAQGDAATANENAANAVETANAVSESLDTLSSTVGGHTSQISALGARMTNAENEIDDVRSDLEDMITAFNEPTATSTHAYAIGDYFIYNDVLYKATAVIAIGDTIVPNTNCTATNVMTEVAAGGGSTPTAADVSLEPITGMAADDVQEGIEELKSALSTESRVNIASISNATTFDSHALDSGKKLSDYESIGFSVLDSDGIVGVAFEVSLAFLKGFTNYTDNRFIIGIAGANDTIVVTYVDDTHIIARSSSNTYKIINVFGINSIIK